MKCSDDKSHLCTSIKFKWGLWYKYRNISYCSLRSRMYFWKPLFWLLDHHKRGYLERWWRWGGGRWWRKRMNLERWERNTCAPCIIIEYQFIVMIIIITSIQPLFIRTGTVTSASLGAWRIFQTFVPTLAKKRTKYSIISDFLSPN